MLALLAICAIIQEVKRRELMERIKKGESSITVSGSDEFKEKAYASLEKLSKTPTGLGLLLELEKTGKSVEIVETSGGNSENPASMADGTYDRVNDQPGPGTSSVVKFNPEKKQIKDGSEDWHKRDPAVALGHELIHSLHDAKGTNDGRNPLPYEDLNGDNRTAPGYEHQAVGLGDYEDDPFTENKIREDMGEDKRPFY